MVNAHKSAADTEALEAISEFYAGLALEESVDTTKLTDAQATDATKKPEVQKILSAGEHYKKAKGLFEAAARDCVQFRERFKSPEELALFDRDIQGFKDLAGMMGKMLAEIDSKMMPRLETSHEAMSAIGEMLAYAKYRAQAHRGMPGHYPAKDLKF